MKYTLLLTQNCTLSCDYCYIGKKDSSMSIQVAEKILDFIFIKTPARGKIEIGYFGGEPLLEFEKIKAITKRLMDHPDFANHPVEIQIVTNGTLFNDEIAEYIKGMRIGLVISCDGIPSVHDAHRKFPGGLPSSGIVEKSIVKALQKLDLLMVNAVYTPATFRSLPETVQYLYTLGVRHIFLNPDYTARWTQEDANEIQGVFEKIGEMYLRWYQVNDPAIVSFLDSKISLILNDGCNNSDKCHMGTREFAFTPDGRIFPCERLVFDGEANKHCIGDIFSGIDYKKFEEGSFFSRKMNPECLACSLKKYCMNWCGCANYFSTGAYDRVSPFTCANEKAAIIVAMDVFQKLSDSFGPKLIPMLLKNQNPDFRA